MGTSRLGRWGRSQALGLTPLSQSHVYPTAAAASGLGARTLLLSQMETRACVVLLWDSPTLLWLFLTLTSLGFWTSDTRQNSCPTPRAIWDGNWNPCTKTQIRSRSNSKKIENDAIKDMTVFKHITFLVQMLFLNFFFFWEGYNLKSLEAREQRSGNWFRKPEKVKIQSSNGENWRLNPESWKGEGTDNIGISRLEDKGGVNDKEGHGQAVWEALNPHCVSSLPLSHTPIAFPGGSLPRIIWRK